MKKSEGQLVGVIGLFALIFSAVLTVLKYVGIAVLVAGAVFAILCIIEQIIEGIYYNGKKFRALREALNENTNKSNELNEHIKELRNAWIDYSPEDFGASAYSDESFYHYKKPHLSEVSNNTSNVYHCSLSVCKNAQNQPFKYLCKYFNIQVNESTLNKVEEVYNNFLAAEEGKQILLREREEIKDKYSRSIPFPIKWFRMKSFFEHLGYDPIDISDSHFPKYTFKYVSAGGNSSMTCDILLNIENLERFISYLYMQIDLKKSMKYQRALMTESLRDEIKKRDNYTCQKCGISIYQEPHLLLEIDHIVPISKNGRTTVDNLQTLCWRCNREKGNKLIN